MLFKFGFFWKTVLTLVLCWSFYGLFGFEMTVITLLGLMFAKQINEKYFVV